MRKRVIISLCALVLAAGLTACGSSSSSPASAASSSAANSTGSQSASVAKDFDGSSYADTGAGTMTLRTSGGTSENGSIPQVAAKENTSMMQIELDYDGGDGTVCTIYIDGMELEKANASERSQKSINLQGAALDSGVHTVEMVAMDGNNVKIYKKAQYEIVK